MTFKNHGAGVYKFIGLMALFISLSLGAEELSTAERIKELKNIQDNITWLEKQIEAKDKELQNSKVEEVQLALVSDLKDLNQKRDNALLSFLEVATSVDLHEPGEGQSGKPRNLMGELEELLMPMIEGLRRLSQKPRMIDMLKSDIDTLEARQKSLTKAADVLQGLYENKAYYPVGQKLSISRNFLRDRLKTVEFDLESKQRKLEKLVDDKRSFWDSAGSLLGTFFKTRGKNLFLSFLSLICIFWGLMHLRARIFRMSFFSHHLQNFKRTLRTLYSSLAVVFSVVGAIICLYILNDWVLVTIFLFSIMGILWSLKTYLPKFLEEIRLIFNLGTVREGERVIWKDLPWLVEDLSFYSKLSNPDLETGTIRVAARDLVNLHSRKVAPGEVWFPTKRLDWVLLGENDPAQVLTQSPEQVIIERIGGSRTVFPASQFYQGAFQNISQGFRVSQVIGLDYETQRALPDGLLKKFEDKFVNKLSNMDQIKDKIKKVTVDFEQCGASSLDLWFAVDCKGELASNYLWAKRRIQYVFLEICNEENLAIPFGQLTISSREGTNLNQRQ